MFKLTEKEIDAILGAQLSLSGPMLRVTVILGSGQRRSKADHSEVIINSLHGVIKGPFECNVLLKSN